MVMNATLDRSLNADRNLRRHLSGLRLLGFSLSILLLLFTTITIVNLATMVGVVW